MRARSTKCIRSNSQCVACDFFYLDYVECRSRILLFCIRMQLVIIFYCGWICYFKNLSPEAKSDPFIVFSCKPQNDYKCIQFHTVSWKKVILRSWNREMFSHGFQNGFQLIFCQSTNYCVCGNSWVVSFDCKKIQSKIKQSKIYILDTLCVLYAKSKLLLLLLLEGTSIILFVSSKKFCYWALVHLSPDYWLPVGSLKDLKTIWPYWPHQILSNKNR